MNTYLMDRRIKSVLLGVSQPAGCAATPINGIEYYKCDYGVYYRAAFRGNNLAYVVSQPWFSTWHGQQRTSVQVWQMR